MLRALLLAFAVVALTSPAQAQLGGLKKRAEKAVANKVAPQANTAARGTPTFDNAVVELTDARVAKMLIGFAAEARAAEKNRQFEAGRKQREAAYQRQLEDHQRARDDWEKKHAVWDRCLQKYRDEIDAKGRDAQARAKTIDTVAIKAIGVRIQAAQARGDRAEAIRLTDSLSRAMAGAMGDYTKPDDTEQRARADCGEEPAEPREPSRPAEETLTTVTDGVRASGMPDDQYRIARERILAWLSLGDDKITRGETKYAFTDAELAALGAKRGELRQYESVLQAY
jgi:hypothetical protein